MDFENMMDLTTVEVYRMRLCDVSLKLFVDSKEPHRHLAATKKTITVLI